MQAKRLAFLPHAGPEQSAGSHLPLAAQKLPRAHGLSAPQLTTTHWPPRQVWPLSQSAVRRQSTQKPESLSHNLPLALHARSEAHTVAGTQAWARQRFLAGQSLFFKQVTQVCVPESHTPVAHGFALSQGAAGEAT